MTELISMVPEAIAGYLISQFKIKSAMASQISLIVLSLTIGMLFFCAFGASELISPSPNPMGNVWLGLLFFSLSVSAITYLIFIVDYLLKKRKKQT